jgi:hypothetical protein
VLDCRGGESIGKVGGSFSVAGDGITASDTCDASVSVGADDGDGDGEGDRDSDFARTADAGIESLPALETPSRFFGVGKGSFMGVASCTTITGKSSLTSGADDSPRVANPALVLFLGVTVSRATSICRSSSSSFSESS